MSLGRGSFFAAHSSTACLHLVAFPQIDNLLCPSAGPACPLQRRDVRRAQLEQQYQQRIAMAPGPRGPMGPGMFPPGGAPPMFYPPGPRGPMAPGMMNPYMMAGPGRGMPGRGPRGMMMPPQMMGPGGARSGRGGRGGRGRGDFPARGRGPTSGRGGRGRGEVAPAPPAGAPAAPTPAAVPAEGGQLTAAMLAAAPPEQQKQLLGERLFPLVANMQVKSCVWVNVGGLLLRGTSRGCCGCHNAPILSRPCASAFPLL
jgi:hypothetical protein